MQSSSSSSPQPGDWLIVIERLEASVYRSIAAGAMPQLVRSNVVTTKAAKTYLNARGHSPLPGYFEPLAGVLHGAQHILIFGRSPCLEDTMVPFIAWLRGCHPDIARRIVSALHVEPHECSDAGLLAKARTIYRLVAVAASTKAALCSAAPLD
jgi:hypothetical protein